MLEKWFRKLHQDQRRWALTLLDEISLSMNVATVLVCVLVGSCVWTADMVDSLYFVSLGVLCCCVSLLMEFVSWWVWVAAPQLRLRAWRHRFVPGSSKCTGNMASIFRRSLRLETSTNSLRRQTRRNHFPIWIYVLKGISKTQRRSELSVHRK